MEAFIARCLLFTPANKPERFAKANEIGADGLIIDLEDAISLGDKDAAREQVIAYLKGNPSDSNGFIRALRINSLQTRAGIKDLAALTDHNIRPDILVLPKSESAHEIDIINALLGPDVCPIIPLVETSTGMLNAAEIAKANNVVGLIFGGADYSADLGAKLAWGPMHAGRSHIALCAASAGIAAIDVPYLHLKDPDDSGVIAETEQVAAMGYTCKLSIHPKHVKPILDTLSPSEEEVDRAKQVVAAYEAANGNACEINGKMIDVPVYKSAKRVLALVK